MKISVITVCRNTGRYIGDALRSVDAQSWPDIEHVVLDGASTDDTMTVVRQHQRAWRHVISERDHGIYDAMNHGIRIAHGDVIGFLNSDDYFASADVLERVAAVMEDPAIDGCYGDLCYVEREHVSRIVRYWRSAPFHPGAFLSGWCPPHPTLYLRRSVFDRFGDFDLRYKTAADVEFMARVMEVHRISTRHIPGILVTMRNGGASNRNLRSIMTQNREIWHALTTHGLRPSLVRFAVGKVLSRSQQFLRRPA